MTEKQGERAKDDGEGLEGGAVKPDEMPGDLVEFLASVDLHRRRRSKPHLEPKDLFEILVALGYRKGGKKGSAKAFAPEYEKALATYKRRSGRLFPTWGEIFGVLKEMGWARGRKAA